MDAVAQLSTQWQGRVVEGKFPLLRELGKSNHSIVFLTEYGEKEPRKAAIKLVPVEAERARGNEEAQLARWKEAAGLAHPHLVKLLDFGRCQIDNTRFLYVVTEFAEENLGEILPLRPLSPEEAQEMLGPAAAALDRLHRAGYVHGHIRPSNILAVNEQLKISIDGIGKPGEPGGAPTAYDAPEKAATGVSAEGDVWSLGQTVLAVLTQKEPAANSGGQSMITVPSNIPQTLRDIAQKCLRLDPQQRCTAADILNRLERERFPTQAPSTESKRRAGPVSGRKKATAVLIGAAVLLVVVLIVGKLLRHNPRVPEANNSQSVAAPAEPSTSNSPPPFSKKQEDLAAGPIRGSVLQQVMPEVSASALKTIQGRLRVNVQVDVDSSGSVSTAKLAKAGPSRYFADRALAAARKWKFNPPRKGGESAESEWMLRFQFRKSSVEVFPSEIKP